MNNFKNPQYLTKNGLARTAKKPTIKSLRPASAATTTTKTENQIMAPRLRLLAEKRILAKRALERKKRGISEETAKMIAEAIKSMLRSEF